MDAAPPAQPLLEAEDLGIERGGRTLFSALALRLEPGEIVHLGGENGAGKTTLLRILAGLTRYGFEGSCRRHAECLYLGHHAAVKVLLTCSENLLWHPSGLRVADTEAVASALEAVGLAGYEDVPAGQLSAGQQRRVNLARLFISDSPLWLLDEPFTAIDVNGVASLEARMRAHAQGGGAVLLTSHQPLSAALPVRLLHLERGGVEEGA